MATQRDLDLVWASSGSAIDPTSSKYNLGWVIEKPAYQSFNYVLQNLDNNLLALAERGVFEWQAEITYEVQAKVKGSNGLFYTALVANANTNPVTDNTRSTWSLGMVLGTTTSTTDNQGLNLFNVVGNRTLNFWDGSDISITANEPLIHFKTIAGSVNNWLLGNIQGEMAVVDTGTASLTADGRAINLQQPWVYRMYHEGFKPTQADVSGTTPINTNTNVLEGRYNNSWAAAVSATANATGAQVDAGTSTIRWVTPQSLTDSGYSGTKATGADVIGGANDTRYVTPKAIADSNYVTAPDIMSMIYPVGRVFESTSPANPATYLDFGSTTTVWALIGQGRSTICIDTNDGMFNVVKEIGGSKNLVNVSHSHVFVGAPLASHNHQLQLDAKSASSGNGGANGVLTNTNTTPNLQNMVYPNNQSLATSAGTPSGTVEDNGVSGTNQNVHPYIVVYRWERTS